MLAIKHIRQWERREWVVLFAVVVVGIAVIAVQEIKGQGDITGTLSRAGQPVKQDGTSARPYSAMPTNARQRLTWFFCRAVAQSRAFLRVYRFALLEISRSKIPVLTG
jgi:hypothetical protein